MKLFFFDIDGTILTQGKDRYVPDSAMEAVRMLQAQGHLCFINTGRAMSEVRANITCLGFDGFVCGCGTYITCHNVVLMAYEIPGDLADSIVRDMEECHLEWVLEGKASLYYSNVPYTTHIGDFYDDCHRDYPGSCTDVDPGTPGLHFDKFCVCLKPDHDFPRFYETYKDQLDFIDRGHDFYEIAPAGYSKASGMQFLMDYYHVAKEDTIAIGDSTNDLPMLQFAGTSIAMKESDDAVLKAVDYVTDTVENHGIYKAMQHFSFIE